MFRLYPPLYFLSLSFFLSNNHSPSHHITMEPEPHRLTATDALQLIKSNNLTVESYARSLLSRIDTRDPAVKAWVHLNPDAVLQQARLLDKIPADQRGPLHGVPIAVKDVMYTKGDPPPLSISTTRMRRELFRLIQCNRYANRA